MRIVSLDPFITELIYSLGVADQLCGVSRTCQLSREHELIPRVTIEKGQLGQVNTGYGRDLSQIAGNIAKEVVNLGALKESNPDLILTTLPWSTMPETEDETSTLEATLGLNLSDAMSHGVRVRIFGPRRLDDVFLMYERLGVEVANPVRGREMAQRSKAQMLDWCDNFYDRMKNKRVSFIAGVDPLKLGGLWIPDMISFASASGQYTNPGGENKVIDFADIVAFRPDVILVAPEGRSLLESARTFKDFEAIPEWENLPAVKRGEVFFSDGVEHFFCPSLKLVDSMGILVSAMAGMDSGYISKRDSFYRLRWLELQRHRLGI